MPEIEVDIEIFCARCGEGLCSNTTAGRTHGRKYPFFNVSPCEKCLEESYDNGREKGMKEGYDDGNSDGYEQAKIDLEDTQCQKQ